MPLNEPHTNLVHQPSPAVKNTPVESEFTFTLQGLFAGLYRSRILIVACALLGLLIGIAIALLPRHYTAVSRVEVRPGSSSQYRVGTTDPANPSDDSTKLETEAMILDSDSLLLDVAHKLRLDQNADFMGMTSGNTADPDNAKSEEKLLTRLHANIHSTRVPRTEIILVSARSKSGMLSAQIVNTLVAEYIQRLYESRFSSTQRVTKFLSSQLDDLKKQVEDDEDKLLKVQNRLGIVGQDQTHDIVVTELEDLTKAADEARVDRIVAEARYRILNGGDSNLLEGGQDILGRTLPSSSQLSLLANLRNQKAQTESRLSGLTAQFGSSYPEVKQATAELATLNREIQQEQARVLNQAHQAFSAASSDEQKTFATLKDRKSEAFQKQGDMVQYQILLHDFEASRTLYESLVQRLRQAGIVAGLDSSEVDIVDMARVPGKPSDVSRLFALAAGLFVGLAIGIMGAVLVAQFDRRVEEVSAIENEMGLPLLSVSPALVQPINNIPDLFLRQQASPFVESMWSLHAALMYSNAGHAPRTLLFTSCSSGEGKTTLASAQACAMALRDARVLLIDADMRRPSVMKRFGLPNKVGLSSVLGGTSDVSAAIQRVENIPNLSVLTSGPETASAALLLGGKSLGVLLDSLSERYDCIVLNSPPLLGLADSSSLARFAEAIVLVVSYPRLNKAHIGQALKMLQRVGRTVTGMALNFADPDSLGHYGYGNSYSSTKSSGKKN